MDDAHLTLQLSELPLPWQQQQWERAMHQLGRGRLAHALLLRGPAGLGKTQFARALVQATLCRASTGESRPCGRCPSCIQVQAEKHPDVFMLEPEEDKKTIRVDQVRALAADLALTSHDGGAKVAIINPADWMNVHTANSLLKTLEEPPAGTFIVLISAHPARLPATIRSRCQTLTFTPPSSEEAQHWLEQHMSGRQWAPLLGLVGNSPLAAAELARADTNTLRVDVVDAVLDILAGRLDPVDVAERYTKQSGELVSRILHTLAADILRLKLIPDVHTLANADRRERLQKATAALDWIRLFAYTDRLKRVRALLNTSVNAQVLIEALLLPWAEHLELEEDGI